MRCNRRPKWNNGNYKSKPEEEEQHRHRDRPVRGRRVHRFLPRDPRPRQALESSALHRARAADHYLDKWDQMLERTPLVGSPRSPLRSAPKSQELIRSERLCASREGGII